MIPLRQYPVNSLFFESQLLFGGRTAYASPPDHYVPSDAGIAFNETGDAFGAGLRQRIPISSEFVEQHVIAACGCMTATGVSNAKYR